ncbi:hypothetical protein RLC82_02945, partial [Streptococcus pneumoniae]|nr:hypothetical protein [Streptococcus pneumoniae]MDT5538388.1 hypothetical protein [Streptococcus pneumoniae]
IERIKKSPHSPIATPSHGSIVQKRGKLKNRKPIYRLKRKIGQKCNKHEAHCYYFSFRAAESAENATYSIPTRHNIQQS